MDVKTQFQIRSNYYLSMYLRENSYWYKELNRNPASIINLEREVKEHYHLTAKDKMQDLGRKIEFVRNFMDILN